MSEDDRSLLARLFEPASIEEQAPIARVLTYGFLALWSLVVLIPLYWVFITSFKGAGEVDNGPFYLPFVDFQPNLDAWRFMLIENNTLGPYMNSVVVALGSIEIEDEQGRRRNAAYSDVWRLRDGKLAELRAFVIPDSN